MTFIHKGFGFPFTVTKPWRLKTDEDLIVDSATQILGTRLKERFYLPDFGSNLRDPIFELNDAADVTKALVATRAPEAIEKWDTRLLVRGVTFYETAETAEAGQLEVGVDLAITATDETVQARFVFQKAERRSS